MMASLLACLIKDCMPFSIPFSKAVMFKSFTLMGLVALVDAEWRHNYRKTNQVSLRRFVTVTNAKVSTSTSINASSNLDLSRWTSVPISVNSASTYTTQDIQERSLVASTMTRLRRVPSLAPPTEDEEEVEAVERDPDIFQGVTQALVKTSIWERLNGRELESPSAMEKLVQNCLALTRHHDNEWVNWKATDKITEEAQENKLAAQKHLAEGEIFCYLGRCSKEQDTYYGGKLPIIKTISVIPMTPLEIADLMLDSSKVQTYNKFSLGRTDLKQIEVGTGRTKIVRNLTKPLIGDEVQSTTLIHARELENGSYVVVSRAVPSDEENSYGKSEILLGVNLMVPHSGSSSLVTSVTHVYSPSLPGLLAARLGVASAINFVKDLRDSVQPR
jgi:hypothetical protein